MEISSVLADAAADLVENLCRNLVILHNGRHGVGAGILWETDRAGNSLILTNQHVVAKRGAVQAELVDGRVVETCLLASDAEIDLALLETSISSLEPARIADSQGLRVGELVFAVGHPWGQRWTVTAGLVSAVSKTQTRDNRREIEIIRSDARLAPGNSGGPLVNAAGEVVGINTLIVGGDQGIAISSHIASQFVERAIKRG